MTDDHGTLRHDDGSLKEYRVLHPTLPNVPLMESQVWPADMSDREAEDFAAMLEDTITRRLGFVACSGDHSDLPCSVCRAAI